MPADPSKDPYVPFLKRRIGYGTVGGLIVWLTVIAATLSVLLFVVWVYQQSW